MVREPFPGAPAPHPRRTLAALVPAITPPLTVLAVSGVQAQPGVTVPTGETLAEIAERSQQAEGLDPLGLLQRLRSEKHPRS